MKRMTFLLVAFVLGLAVGGFFALRHARRAPGGTSQSVVNSPPASPQALRPIDRFQDSIKLGTKSTDTPAAKADRQLREKLRRLEAEQRPQEGRN